MRLLPGECASICSECGNDFAFGPHAVRDVLRAALNNYDAKNEAGDSYEVNRAVGRLVAHVRDAVNALNTRCFDCYMAQVAA